MPHNWTQFEQQALLGLLCRSIHTTGLSEDPVELDNATPKKRKRLPDSRAEAVAHKHAHVDVATALNRAINNGDYKADIPIAEVSQMIDKLLAEKKAAKLFMERQRVGRVTKTMRKVWERGIGFDGTLREWEGGRKEEEARKREERGIGGVLRSVELDTRNTADAVDAWGEEVAAATNLQAVVDAAWETVDGVAAAPDVSDDWGAEAESGAVGKSSQSTTGISGQTLPASDDGWGGAGTATVVVSNSEWGSAGTTGTTVTSPAVASTKKSTPLFSTDGWRAEAAREDLENSSWPATRISGQTRLESEDGWGGADGPTLTVATLSTSTSAKDTTTGTSSTTEWDWPSATVTPLDNNQSVWGSVDIQDPPVSKSTSALDKDLPWAHTTAPTTVLNSNSPQDSPPAVTSAWDENATAIANKDMKEAATTTTYADSSTIPVTTDVESAAMSSSGKPVSFAVTESISSEQLVEFSPETETIHPATSAGLTAPAEHRVEENGPAKALQSHAPLPKVAVQSEKQTVLHSSNIARPGPMAMEGINPQRLAMIATGAEIDTDMTDKDRNDDAGELGKKKRGGKGAKGWVASGGVVSAKGSNAMPLAFNRLDASRSAAGRGPHDDDEAGDISREGD